MSELIDRLVDPKRIKVSSEINGKWYIAKPCLPFFRQRLKDAWRVLIGTSCAYHFKQDEVK